MSVGYELGRIMAVWQVEFAIVPRRALATTPPVPLAEIMDADWWSSERLPSGYFQQLAAFAPSGSPSAAQLQTWGEQDGKRVDVWFENGKAALAPVVHDLDVDGADIGPPYSR